MVVEKQSIQVLVSTMWGKYKAESDSPRRRIVIVDQTDYDQDLVENGATKVVRTTERGLSRSRNRALELADGELCLISDDDVQLLPNAEDIIAKAFLDYPEADLITFQVVTPEGNCFKLNYSSDSFWHSLRTSMRVCSIEIAFRRRSVIRAGLRFDENFGLGAPYPTGEENIFLADALRRGLRCRYVPIPIVVHPAESSGANFYLNHRLVLSKGAMLYRIFGRGAYFICPIFALAKYRKSGMSLYTFYIEMMKGMSVYKYSAMGTKKAKKYVYKFK